MSVSKERRELRLNKCQPSVHWTNIQILVWIFFRVKPFFYNDPGCMTIWQSGPVPWRELIRDFIFAGFTRTRVLLQGSRTWEGRISGFGLRRGLGRDDQRRHLLFHLGQDEGHTRSRTNRKWGHWHVSAQGTLSSQFRLARFMRAFIFSFDIKLIIFIKTLKTAKWDHWRV